MKPEWKSFLENKGAELEDETVVSYGNPERELRIVAAGDVIVDLSHTGLISVHGEDSVNFLQGQLTNDVRQISGHRSQLSAYCSPKGRILANFRIFKHGDTYYLHMPREQVDPTLKRLRMFVLISKVTLEDASDHFVRLGCSGPDTESRLREQFSTAPEQANDVLQTDEYAIIRLPGPHPRFEIYGELDPMKKLWTLLDVRAAPVGATPWALLDIYAGVPTIVPATAEAFVPQMANLQLIEGINFKKGCYTGQEVVARMQYLGRLKRRMYRAHVETPTCPAPGDTLYAAGSTSGQGAGKIVNASPSPEGGCEVLAVIEISSQENDDIHLGSPDGPKLNFAALPYPFEPAKAPDQT